MTDPAVVTVLASTLGPLIGAGAGSYFGLKSALNGLKERSTRIEARVDEIRDDIKAAKITMHNYAESARKHMDRR